MQNLQPAMLTNLLNMLMLIQKLDMGLTTFVSAYGQVLAPYSQQALLSHSNKQQSQLA